MSLAAGTRLGSYEVVSSVGDDRGGEVYRARDTRLPRDVTIRTLPPWLAGDPTRRARFEHDAQTIARLNHPNIRRIYELGDQEGVAFLVMEHVEGESLDVRLRSGPLPWRTALEIALQITGALEAAHKAGIVHRDLKPANVVLVRSFVKLLDFGTATPVEPAEVDATSAATPPTAEQEVAPTPHYMAPEQLEGREVDARTDVFALGAVLHEMLTGRKAFDGESAASVTTAVMTLRPPPISQFLKRRNPTRRTLDHLVQRCLAKRREDRWQTARDLRHELQWMLDSNARISARSAARSRRLVRIGVVAALLLAIGGVIGQFARLARTGTGPARMVTFTINPPEGTHLGRKYGLLAVSPDSSKIAFIATENGKSSLWVRAVGDTDAHPIPNTEGADHPFWSPDSRSIAFFAVSVEEKPGSLEFRGTDIKRVEVSGGPSQQVTTLIQLQRGRFSGVLTACWMPDGTIILAADSSRSSPLLLFPLAPAAHDLYSVSASVGANAQPVPLHVTDDKEWASVPTSLGGGMFSYLVVRYGEIRNLESHIGGRPGAPTILPSVESNAFLASGYLIFRRDAAIVAQKFDERTLALIGKPIVLAPDVDYDPATGRTTFAASSTVLAYQQVRRQLSWFDRSGQRLGSLGDERDGDPVIAWDGSNAVAVDRHADGSARIWTMDGQGPSAPVNDSVDGEAPVWSLDRQWLAFRREKAAGSTLYRSRVSGIGGTEKLLDVAGVATPIDWSHDNRLLLYSVDSDLWTYEFDTRKRTRLTTVGTIEKGARLSPDGQWLAYSARDVGGQIGLWVKRFPDGQPVRVGIGDGFDQVGGKTARSSTT
jgi:serine/threonine protein kinase/Tol biopolymer transport system component